MAIIALVDDDSIFQFTATRLLESSKLAQNILHFENGAEALTFLREKALQKELLPDYLFLDINMPFVDGWMFLEDFTTLKSSLAKDISIFMVSSSIDPRDLNRAKSFSEVTDFIIKPISLERFQELLKSAQTIE
ncbi:MAG: response regulator [Cytophagales bacterium]|jgi:two-component system chemotaxis response regulator CheY|nr:response regulator [Cytophagales bacterium]MCA6387321.1 response regulator [Cytophagales bacterium]MCA6390130.1 response regulator [Cytophagales bacterium]MCA6393588.1 response regulator [Cytophagales bacterium]MCA6397832.1 response regulator [Cytophagales bacterium]